MRQQKRVDSASKGFVGGKTFKGPRQIVKKFNPQ